MAMPAVSGGVSILSAQRNGCALVPSEKSSSNRLPLGVDLLIAEIMHPISQRRDAIHRFA
jgi:hypothetical protein